mgnify:CR=1 FL=1
MFQHLLAAVDGSEMSLKALNRAIDLAARLGADLDVVSVAEDMPPPYVTDRTEVNAERSAGEQYYGEIHAQAKMEAMRKGVQLVAAIVTGHEVQALVEYVRHLSADLLVLGARGHSGVWQAFLGSTADKLVAHTPTSVLVVRPEDSGRSFREILVGLDGSPLGERAFAAALDLCRALGGTLRAISVIEDSPTQNKTATDAEQAYFEGVQTRACAASEAANVRLGVMLRQGHAAKTITSYAAEIDADLLVIGATGHGRPWSLTAGGTARHIANEAGHAVLVVRPVLQPRQVSDVMIRHVTSVSPDTPIRSVLDHLFRRRVKALPVVDAERRVVGIVTGGDLLERGALGLRLALESSLSAGELAAQFERLASSGLTAQNVMTRSPHTIGAEAPLEAAIHLLVTCGVKRLPVVEDGNRLAGIISRADILRAIAAGPSSASEAPIIGHGAAVSDVMTRDVVTVGLDAPAEEVLTAVLGSPFRRVVVVDDERHVLGTISDRRLLAHADAQSRPGLLARLAGLTSPSSHASHEPLTAAALMAGAVFTIPATASLEEAARQFTARRVKRLVVVDDDQRLAGIVDRRAFLQSLVPATANGNGP